MLRLCDSAREFNGWLRPQAALIASALILGAGCAADSPPAVRLVIDSPIDVPDPLYALRITVTASRDPNEPRLCMRVGSPDIRLVRQSDLPVRVTIERGTVYAAWAAYRIEAFGPGGDSQPRFRRSGRTSWPAAGVLEVPIVVEPECFDFECPADEQCVASRGAAECRPAETERFFGADLSLFDYGVSCDSAAPIEDAGGDADGTAESGE
ncbi:MAG: hypothetical protein QME96_10430 [Myxococcota bacterium]|nr:hypothetical protein [Myxococcota bacterium]